MSPFPLPRKSDTLSKSEENILAYWKKNKIFEKTIESRSADKEFVFFDGPPFATGTPHYGHILAGTLKDTIPRYKTMRGYRVNRKWGWDCHGVPVEFQVEKENQIGGKPGIEAMGIGNFNEMCRSIVFRCRDQWENTVERMGRFVDFKNDYKTMDPEYMESVWWVFSQLWEKGLIYEGEKVVPYSPKLGSPLSNFEAGLNYKDIDDPAITVKFKLLSDKFSKDNEDVFLLAWTTTPWTLPSNLALVVNPKIQYIKTKSVDGKSYILAKNLVEQVFKDPIETQMNIDGKSLIDLKYEPLFPFFKTHKNAFRIIGGTFVSDDSGTGIVHAAPNFGEEDSKACFENKIKPLKAPIDENGYFDDTISELAGKYFRYDREVGENTKDNANDWVLNTLKEQNKIFHRAQIRHSYPYCWRTEAALMYRGINTWFVDIQKIKPQLLENNKNINWTPEYLKYGRFGKGLETAPDWAISRNRYWGTPMPVWRCDKTGEVEVIGSKAELEQKSGKKLTDLHRHFIDDLTWKNEKTGGTMHRIAEVLDCWFESGSMPYASQHYPFEPHHHVFQNEVSIIRHGEAENNVLRFHSCTEESAEKHGLTEKGKKQTLDLAKKHTDIDYIFHSPLRRARETAEILAKKSGAILIADDRIREVHVGDFDEKSYAEEKIFRTTHDIVKTPYPNGENFSDVEKRVSEFLLDIDKKYKNKRIFVVSHGTPVQVMQSWFHGQEAQTWQGKIENATAYPLIPEFQSADFIAEGLDQTRCWFYNLHVLGTALFGKNIYKNVITNGIVLAEDGTKMSKSKKNYPDPAHIFDEYGADAVRFYLLNSPVARGENLRFSEHGVAEVLKSVILPLKSAYQFFATYANIDKWQPPKNLKTAPIPKTDLDSWILSELQTLIQDFRENFDAYNLEGGLKLVPEFIDKLNNWYLRRSRRRFWASGMDDEKKSGYETLHFVLYQLSHVLAPVCPFLAEKMYQDLGGGESVHLEMFPEPIEELIHRKSEKQVHLSREIVGLSAGIRAKKKIKLRQPLGKLQFMTTEKIDLDFDILREEANVKEIEVLSSVDDIAQKIIRVNAKLIGPRLGKKVQEIIRAGKEGDFEMQKDGTVKIANEILEPSEYEMGFVCKEGIEADSTQKVVVMLNTEITDSLRIEGFSRELIRAIQELRKTNGFQISDRISLRYHTHSEVLKQAFQKFGPQIGDETLAEDIINGGDVPEELSADVMDIAGEKALLIATKS